MRRCALPTAQSGSMLGTFERPRFGATPRTWAAFCRLLDDIEADNRCSGEQGRVVSVTAFGSYGSLEVVLLVTDKHGSPLSMETKLIQASMV